jgi:P27 family predicted phage terminase small subunit
MGRRGPKPTPTTIRKRDGNPSHRPLNVREPQLPAPDVPFDDPPDALTNHPVARAEWMRLAPLLRKAGQITEADRSALVALCIEWDRYLDAMTRVQTLGLVVTTKTGYPMTNPYLSIATKALAGCNRLWPELGLTPSSRSRVQASQPLDLPGDPFAEFDLPMQTTEPQ